MIRQVRNLALMAALFSASWYGGRRLGVYLGERRPVRLTPVASGTGATAERTPCFGMPGPSKMPCYRTMFAKQIAASGIEKAMDTLRAITVVDSDVARDSHMYAHMIGIDAFRQHPDLGAIFSHCSALFSSGCYHGVMQAYFKSREVVDSGVVRATCRPYASMPGSNWLFFQCLHGMGHGLDMAFDHELPRALSACDMLAQSWERHSCYGGVFMENINQAVSPHDDMVSSDGHSDMHMAADMPMKEASGSATPAAHHWHPYRRHDLQYPCSVVAERYKSECYGMQTSLLLFLTESDFRKTAVGCDRAPRAYRRYCYESLGRDLAGYAEWRASAAIQLCAVSTPAYRGSCYVGAAETFVNEATKADPGFEICRSVSVAKDRAACFQAVGTEIITLATDPKERARICALPNESDAQACRKGAEVEAHSS